MKRLFMLSILLLGMISLSYSVIDYDTDVDFATLIDWNTTTTATNDLINGKNMVSKVGTAVIDTTNYYADFKADGYLRFPNDVNLQTPYTYTTLVFIPTSASTAQDKGFVSKWQTGADRHLFFSSNNFWQARTITDVGGGTCSATLNRETWYLLVVSDDGVTQTIKFQLTDNNVQSCLSTAGNAPVTSSIPFDLGGSGALSAYYLEGYMSQFYMFNKVLSDTEIDAHYDNVYADRSFNPFTPTVPAVISIDDISLINNSYFNSDFVVSLNLSQTDSNNNINTTFTTNIYDNNVFHSNIGGGGASPVYADTTSANQYCLESYGGNVINFSTSVSISSVSKYNGSEWITGSFNYITNINCNYVTQIGTNTLTPSGTIDLTIYISDLFSNRNLNEGVHTGYFYSYNNETSVTSENYTYYIDTVDPIVNLIGNVSEDTFSIDFSTIFNVTELNPSTCVINITELEIVETSDNFLINCTDTQAFDTAGLHNAYVTATDLAGNIGTYSYNFSIIPFINIYFTDISNSSIVYGYSPIIYHPDGRETIPTIQSGGNIQLSPINNGSLDLGVHNISFSKLGYGTELFSYNVTASSAGVNQTYNVTQSQIKLSIYDRETGSILTGLSTITLVDTIGYNSTTTTGYLNITNVNFIAGQYQLIVSHTGYTTESIYFTYSNQEILPVTISLLNATSANFGYVIVELTADTGQLIQGAVCKALEWKPSQSAFISVAESLTNSNGQAILNLELNTKLYKFSCEKAGTLVLSPQQIVTTTGTTIPLEMSTSTATEYDIFTTLTYSLTNTTFNATHDTITFTWSETNGLVAQGCINIYNVKGTRKTLLSNNCATGSTSQKQVVTSINNSFNKLIKGVVIDINGRTTKLDSIPYKSYYDLSRSLQDYHLDIILPLIAVLVGIGLGLVLSPQNIYISQITVIILIWITAGIVPSVISSTIAVSVTVIAGLMLWGGFKVK